MNLETKLVNALNNQDETSALRLLRFNTNIQNENAHSCLKVAADKGYIKIVDFLLNTCIFETDTYQECLNRATQHGHTNVIKRLLASNKCDYRIGDYHVFRIAIKYRQSEAIKLLIELYKNDFKLLNYIIRYCVINNKYNLLDYITKNTTFNPNYDSNSLLRWGAEKGHIKLVHFLLIKETDKSTLAQSTLDQALFNAAIHNHLNVVELLLRHKKANPSAMRNYLIKYAAENGLTELAKMILKHKNFKINVNGIDNAFPKYAAWKGHSETLKVFLSDARFNPADENNIYTRLSALSGDLKTVQILVDDPRTDPAAESNEAIFNAATNGFADIVDCLITGNNHGRVQVDASDNKNRALMSAVTKGHSDVVKRLLQPDTKVDPSSMESHALNLASLHNQIDVLLILLEDERVNPEFMVIPNIGIVEDDTKTYELNKLEIYLSNILDKINLLEKAIKIHETNKPGCDKIIQLTEKYLAAKEQMINYISKRLYTFQIAVLNDSPNQTLKQNNSNYPKITTYFNKLPTELSCMIFSRIPSVNSSSDQTKKSVSNEVFSRLLKLNTESEPETETTPEIDSKRQTTLTLNRKRVFGFNLFIPIESCDESEENTDELQTRIDQYYVAKKKRKIE